MLNGQLAPNSERSYDLSCAEYGRVQVKSRIVRGSGSTALSPFRSFDFDRALILIFERDYTVKTATILDAATIEKAARMSHHVAGSIITVTQQLLALGVSIADRFVGVAA